MEIELDLSNTGSFALVLIGVLIVFAFIGHTVTPPDGRVLTWTEWQVYQARREFYREVEILQAEAQRLSVLLQKRDPVRTQLAVQRLRGRLEEVNSPALAAPKARLLEASQAVLDWAQGMGDYNAAVQTLNTYTEAMETLNEP